MTRACLVSCSSPITRSMPPNARSIEVEAPSHHCNRNSIPPRRVWSMHVHQLLATNSALGHKQSWQRTNTTKNLPARQPPGPLPLRHREARTDQQRVNHTIRLRLSNETTRIETHKRISRGATAASSASLWCLQMVEHDNRSPSPINSSNNARRQQLTLARSSPFHAAHIQKPRHTSAPGRHPLLRYLSGDLRDSQTRNGTHQPFTIIHNNTISIELNTSAPSHSFTPFALPTIVFFNLAPSSNTSRAKYIQRVTHWPLIDILSITSFLEPEVTRFHDATLTKQQIVRFDVLPFNNTSITYSMNHTSHIKMKQAW